MPNKTIYVKDTDWPLLEQAQQKLGESVSSMFAEFLRERVERLTPEENRIIELINQITASREAADKDPDLSGFVDSEHGQARNYGENALKSFRAGDVSNAKVLLRAANAYFEEAQSHAKRIKKIRSEVAELLENVQKPVQATK
jgi:hypothetical protein